LPDSAYTSPVTLSEVIALLLIGLFTGVVGGMLGVGGSIFSIPALTFLFGPNQHLYQATAMIMNVVVAIAGSIKHHKARAIRWDVGRRMLPVGILFVMIGVALSNRVDSWWLQRVFSAFLVYTALVEVVALLRRRPEPIEEQQRVDRVRCGIVGGVMGLVGGVLGIGGGGVTVPLLRRICHLPIRQAIATSSAVMVLTAAVGAAQKNLTLAEHLGPDGVPLSAWRSVIIALCMAPAGIVGGMIGATLTHRLPTVLVKVAFITLITIASLKMFELF
jgi:uncharacterized protein